MQLFNNNQCSGNYTLSDPFGQDWSILLETQPLDHNFRAFSHSSHPTLYSFSRLDIEAFIYFLPTRYDDIFSLIGQTIHIKREPFLLQQCIWC